MSDFEIEITESEVFPEVKILKPEPWFDYRGEMWTFWEKENEILPEGHEWKISKFTRSRKNVLRGLQKLEEKTMEEETEETTNEEETTIPF